tara:strand:- start:103 stop:339 length:237 start_codon:yes stop_codon:yes gene_type:complete
MLRAAHQRHTFCDALERVSPNGSGSAHERDAPLLCVTTHKQLGAVPRRALDDALPLSVQKLAVKSDDRIADVDLAGIV